MSKRIAVLLGFFLLSAVVTGCSKPYDAKSIDPAEVDSPSQQERNVPAGGGGKALKNSQW